MPRKGCRQLTREDELRLIMSARKLEKAARKKKARIDRERAELGLPPLNEDPYSEDYDARDDRSSEDPDRMSDTPFPGLAEGAEEEEVMNEPEPVTPRTSPRATSTQTPASPSLSLWPPTQPRPDPTSPIIRWNRQQSRMARRDEHRANRARAAATQALQPAYTPLPLLPLSSLLPSLHYPPPSPAPSPLAS